MAAPMAKRTHAIELPPISVPGELASGVFGFPLVINFPKEKIDWRRARSGLRCARHDFWQDRESHIGSLVLPGAKMLSNEQLKGAVEKLLAQSVIPENEVKNLFQKAVDCDYWRTLCPELGVMAQRDHRTLQGAPLSPERAAWACGHLERHGYFQLAEVIAPAIVAPMYR